MSQATVSFIGRGGFGQYVSNLLAAEPELKQTWSINVDPHHSSNPFSASSPASDVVYIVTPDVTHTPVLHQVLDAKRNALVEKPAFFSFEDYKRALALSRASNSYVQVNFQRRFDDLYRSARDSVRSALRDEEEFAKADGNRVPSVRVRLTAFDPVPHENDPYKYIHNSVVHDIDTAAWLAYPFESCSVVGVEFDSTQTLRIALSFTKKSSSSSGLQYELPVDITFAKGNKTYLNRIEVETSLSKKSFEEDYSGKVFFDRYRPAYVRAWLNLLKEVNERKNQQQQGEESEYSLAHPSFQATYQLLDDALRICREKVRPV